MPLPDNLTLHDLGEEFPAPGQGMLLEEFSIQKQDLDSWCWAAVAVSVHQFYKGVAFSMQCELATKVLEQFLAGGSCCPAEGNVECAKKLLPQVALLATKNLVDPPRGPLDFSEIAAQINHPKTGRPICCTRVGNDLGGAHVVALTGWEVTAGGERRIFIQNPNGPEMSYYSYEEFLESKERSWVATCLTNS